MRSEALRPRELVALAAILAIAACFIVPRLALPISSDAVNAYLPMARRLLAEGLAFLHRPESLAYAPLAYIYPALLGANEMLIRWTNVVAYGVAIVFAFLAVRSVHGARAALVAALLLAISPTLRLFIADVLTEPPFLFLIAVWIASIAAVIRGYRVTGVVAGAIALGLAALTRPAVMYFPLLLALVFGWRAWRGAGRERITDTALATLHALALLVCGLYVARNAIEFGFPSIAAGAGAAFFFGINPLVDGFDPNYYGLSYDDGAVTLGLSHLSIEGDRLLNRVAMRELADIPFPVLLEMGVRKAFAFVFVTASPVSTENIALVRTWRVVLAAFAAAAVILERRSRIVIALAALTAYMIAVHLPLLYNHRYSVGAIDFPLALLAGIGMAAALKSAARFAVIAFVATLGVALGLAGMTNPGPGSPHPSRSPYDLVWTRDAPETVRLTGDRAIEIPITGAPGFDPRNHFMLEMELAVAPDGRGANCQAMRVRYKGLADARYAPERVVRIPLRADGRIHRLDVGMAHPVFMDREGTLRLEFECDSDATVKLGRISVLAPNRAVVYRRRVTGG